MSHFPFSVKRSTIIAMEFTHFGQVTEYLDSFSYTDRSSGPGFIRNVRLERMENLLAHIGNPEKDFKSVHIAGSKGKGSTATFIAVLLRAKGHKTGLYLSPHLSDYRERFTLAGEFFSDEFLISTANTLKEKVSTFRNPSELGYEHPSTFEMYTAYAYLLFSLSGCEYAVVETGLGGRLDATNTLQSTASVLTPIELEHTNVLGNTIHDIAVEKSKIIKPFQKVFVSSQCGEALDVIRAEAEAQHAQVHLFSEMIGSFSSETEKDGEKLSFSSTGGRHFELQLSVYGRKQAENAALALMIAEEMGFLTDEGIKALSETVLPGRFEIMRHRGKTIVFDVAHTVNSLNDTVRTFRKLWPQGGVCIFGAVAGKDIAHMSRVITENFSNIIISRPGMFKKSNIDEIFRLMKDQLCDNEIQMISDNRAAMEKALEDEGPILITGSFYLAGELLSVLKDLK